MRPIALAAALLLGATALAQEARYPTAAETDPTRLGLMQGSPVPPEKQVRFDDGSMSAFPKTRWSFSNIQALLPTRAVPRSGPVSPLATSLRTDLDRLPVTTLDGRQTTWGEAFDLNYTDGIIVLHKGRIVYERYAGALDPDGRHIAFSVTKSFVGTLAELLIHEGKLDPAKPAAHYVPELAGSAFGNATVRQIMDMRTAIDFSEDYAAAGLSDVAKMSIAGGIAPRPQGFEGADGTFAFIMGLKAYGPHGGPFVYRTPNTTALQWIVERAGGAPFERQLAERIWKPMGMEQEATLMVDRLGTSFGGGGMNANLRDYARFGEMVRKGGRWNGRQVLPPAVVKAILTPGDPTAFDTSSYPGLEGGSYRSQWWHRAGGQTYAVGIHGQAIYIDPAAEMVIARFASHPVATNRVINLTTLPAYDAMAAALSARR
jgi:hypothetical protein